MQNDDTLLPTMVYFNDDHSNSAKCTEQVSTIIKAKYILISTWQELAHELENGAEFLVFHDEMITRTNLSIPEFIDMITVLDKCTAKPGGTKLKIGVIITTDTPLANIRTMQKTAVTGILLDFRFYSKEEAATSINAFVNNIPYWPKHIINSLPGAVKKPQTPGINLTARQEQVFNLIRERGASNKVIAKILGISESTVKLHVTETLKKCGVRNRTQLAVFGY